MAAVFGEGQCCSELLHGLNGGGSMNARFDWWCRAAVEQIRYGPDRQAVYAELYAHLEDRYEAELPRWETPEEAMEATLKAMGNAGELAPQLAAVHRPFWGYLLTCTRWLIGFLLVLLALDLVVFVGNNRGAETYTPWYYENPGEEMVRVWEDGEGESVRVLDYDPDAKDVSDGFRFDVTRATMVHSDYYDGIDKDVDLFLFRIEVRSILQWNQLRKIPLHDFYAVDSVGNVYLAYNDWSYSVNRFVSGNLEQNGPFSWTMDMWLQSFVCEGAEWIEIRYDRDGRDICLRIDLTGGGGK